MLKKIIKTCYYFAQKKHRTFDCPWGNIYGLICKSVDFLMKEIFSTEEGREVVAQRLRRWMIDLKVKSLNPRLTEAATAELLCKALNPQTA